MWTRTSRARTYWLLAVCFVCLFALFSSIEASTNPNSVTKLRLHRRVHKQSQREVFNATKVHQSQKKSLDENLDTVALYGSLHETHLYYISILVGGKIFTVQIGT